jgi:hypothetical protein
MLSVLVKSESMWSKIIRKILNFFMQVSGRKSRIITKVGTGGSLLVSPSGGAGTDGVLEALGYSTGIHIPDPLRDGFGSNYNPAWYPKTNMSGITTIVIKDILWGKLELFGIKGTAAQPIHIVTENDAIVTFTKGLYLNDCEYVTVNGIPSGTIPPKRYPTLA